MFDRFSFIYSSNYECDDIDENYVNRNSISNHENILGKHKGLYNKL